MGSREPEERYHNIDPVGWYSQLGVAKQPEHLVNGKKWRSEGVEKGRKVRVIGGFEGKIVRMKTGGLSVRWLTNRIDQR